MIDVRDLPEPVSFDPIPEPAPHPDPRVEAGRERRRALERLGEQIARLSAHVSAATYRLLVMIRAFDEGEGWHEQGFRSCAQWLSWRTGLGPGAARERVRVARTLGALPVLSKALEAGRLSYSVARALTRVATPENEAELVEVARHTPAADLERLVRAWKRADRTEEEEAADERKRHARRGLRLVPAPDGSWRVRGRLDPEAGAVLQKALEAAAEALYRREGDGGESEEAEDVEEPPSPEARRADALGLVAEAALGGGLGAGEGEVVSRAERFQVVVRVSAETLAGAEGAEEGGKSSNPGSAGPGAEEPRIAGGPPLSRETARRLACDASLVGLLQDRDGNVLDVGRKTRAVPPALRRALEARDRRCRFPGCRSRYCDAHHLRPWARGGETKLDNLVLLCGRHHRLVHEEGWTVEMEGPENGNGSNGGGGNLRFLRPDGRILPEVPEPPSVPADPVRTLLREQRGLGIDAWTATPRWDGVEMDVDWALFTLGRAPSERGDASGKLSHKGVSAGTPPTEDGSAELSHKNVSEETPPGEEDPEGSVPGEESPKGEPGEVSYKHVSAETPPGERAGEPGGAPPHP